MNIIYLVIGFILLVKGADVFVDSSSKIARKLKIPSLVIGLTIVAFGTSAPEASVSIAASLNGQNEISIANVLGSNIFNILVVTGVAAMISPLAVKKSVILKEYPFAVLSSIALIVLAFDVFLGNGSINVLNKADGFVLLLFFAIFLYSLILFALDNKTQANEQDQAISLPKNIGIFVFGLLMIIFGGKLVVDGASGFARDLGVSENLIGLTIVAIGTSLPELVTSIVAAKKGESDIALGNVIGSNIFNVFFILGMSASLADLAITSESLIDMIVCLGITVFVYLLSTHKLEVNKSKGLIMVFGYIMYLIYIIMR